MQIVESQRAESMFVVALLLLLNFGLVSVKGESSNSGTDTQLLFSVNDKLQTEGFRARKDITRYLFKEIQNAGYIKVAEFGPGGIDRRFPHSNILIDHFEHEMQNVPDHITTYHLDIDLDQVPVEDNGFDFVYSRHLMEDINNPLGAFREMTRLSKRGYIETPSPLIESIVMKDFSGGMPGYPHHRFLFWTDKDTNTLYAIQKFPAINLLNRPAHQIENWIKVLTEYPHMFNNYYQWDVDLGLMPKIVMLKHGYDYQIQEAHTYRDMIDRGAQLSVDHTIAFFADYINPFLESEKGV